MGRRLVTVGHGTLDAEAIAALLRGAGVDLVVDVRRFPGSRRHPHVSRDALAAWLPEAGVGYRWEPRLGGRRSQTGDSPDTWWRVAAFRAYAAYMRTEEFAAGMARLAEDVAARAPAVMCSETVWWRCHRRLVADHAALVEGWQVKHLGHDGTLRAHPVADGARLDDGRIFYDRTG
jgi:uncharacterized protein (DUF488 family)